MTNALLQKIQVQFSDVQLELNGYSGGIYTYTYSAGAEGPQITAEIVHPDDAEIQSFMHLTDTNNWLNIRVEILSDMAPDLIMSYRG